MCGIFGWVSDNRLEMNPQQVVASALQGLKHRGPDDHGVMFQRRDGKWSSRMEALQGPVPLLMGHVRLSILDLSPLGKQPMVTADGRFRLSFNGEVYNYLELRQELEQQGVRFRSHTDSEVVLQAFACWGLDCLNRFTGMFALAVHDDQEKRLYLIRDHFGIKPLYYHVSGSVGSFAFASEIQPLLDFPWLEVKASPQRIYDYLLFGDYDSGEATMIDGVMNLLPGHCMVVDSTTAQVIEYYRYWKPDLSQTSTLSFNEAADQFRGMFLDNVRLHLRSDVPLGAALSGGLDSSAVTCAIRYLEPEMPLPTFTYVASGSEMNEERWADCIISSTGAESHKVSLGPDDMVRDLDMLIRAQGEPFGSTSIYAQYRVFRLAHDNGIKVTMDGQGADEMLAGYIGFPGERLKSLLVHGRIFEAWHFFHATSLWPDRSRLGVFQRLVKAFAPASLYSMMYSMGHKNLKPSWLACDWLHDHDVHFGLPQHDEIYESCWYVRRELASQLTQRGLPALLRHGDRNSMHFSIESRVPFLTRELAEFALSLPEEYLIDRNGTTKALFRHAMREIVPDKILDRRDKVGFATPEAQWLNSLAPWVEDVLDGADDLPIFDVHQLRATWRNIMDGRQAFDWQVWRWLNLIRWTQLNHVQFH